MTMTAATRKKKMSKTHYNVITWDGEIFKQKKTLYDCHEQEHDSIRKTISLIPVVGREKLYFGFPDTFGSQTQENFLFKDKFFACSLNSTFARMHLTQDETTPPLHANSLLKNLKDRSNPIQACMDMKEKYAVLLMSEQDDCLFPTSGSLQSDLELYAATSNGFWGMAYAEFFRFLNFFGAHSHELLSTFGVGFSLNHGSLPVIYETNKVHPDVATALDKIVAWVEKVESLTMCLLNPIGMQHMLPVHELHNITGEVSDVVYSCVFRFLKKREAQVVLAWKRVTDLIATIRKCFKIATLFSAHLSRLSFRMRSDIMFTEETLQAAKAEDPVLFGYKLRSADLYRQVDRSIPFTGYTPFNFTYFCFLLSTHTGVDILDYLPPFQKTRVIVQRMTAKKDDPSFNAQKYMSFLNCCFGVKHADTMKRITLRQQKEWFASKSVCGLKDDFPTVVNVYEYLPYLVIVSRADHAFFGRKRQKVSSDFYFSDLLVGDGRSENSLFGTWTSITKTFFWEFNCKKRSVKVRSVDEDFIYTSKARVTMSKAVKSVAAFFRLSKRKRLEWKFRSFVARSLRRQQTREQKAVFAECARRAFHIQKKIDAEKHLVFPNTNNPAAAFPEKMDMARQQHALVENNLQDLCRRLEYFLVYNIDNDVYLQSWMTCDFWIPVDVFCVPESFPSLQHIFLFFVPSLAQAHRRVVICRAVILDAVRRSDILEAFVCDKNDLKSYVRRKQYF